MEDSTIDCDDDIHTLSETEEKWGAGLFLASMIIFAFIVYMIDAKGKEAPENVTSVHQTMPLSVRMAKTRDGFNSSGFGN